MKARMNPIGFLGPGEKLPILYQDDHICVVAGGDGENGVISIFPVKAGDVVAHVACYQQNKLLVMAKDSTINLAEVAGKPAVVISK